MPRAHIMSFAFSFSFPRGLRERVGLWQKDARACFRLIGDGVARRATSLTLALAHDAREVAVLKVGAIFEHLKARLVGVFKTLERRRSDDLWMWISALFLFLEGDKHNLLRS